MQLIALSNPFKPVVESIKTQQEVNKFLVTWQDISCTNSGLLEPPPRVYWASFGIPVPYEIDLHAKHSQVMGKHALGACLYRGIFITSRALDAGSVGVMFCVCTKLARGI